MQVSVDLIQQHGLTPEEYQAICENLGREPNFTELGIFSVMWSEHCSYKSSRIHLKRLPTSGPHVITGPGENAGVVDIGHGLAVVFKIESHNHPSFIEPYQGAATGVGGIIRDIFTMGARPIALMDSLHFGPLENPRNQLIMEGVVAGIAGYGNCMGIPTIGGELYFHDRYSNNPIVNVFCLGIAPADAIFYGRAQGAENPVLYVGAKTGRDGIHGATMASEEFSENSESKRPTVQVGDPLMEKLLLEACLEAMRTGAIVGIQDMGAAGLTCSTTEMASRARMGIEIDLAKVPQRESGMTPYEIMLSESQERMLLVAEKGKEDKILRIFRKWDLDAVVVGEVREHNKLVVYDHGTKVAELPNLALTEGAPCYNRPARRPAYLDQIPAWQEWSLPAPADYGRLLLQLAASPHLCSRHWIYRQYDHMVRTNTVTLPGSDAAVVRVKDSPGALAMSLDGNSRFCYLDPSMGAMLAVAESCRNVVCSGARPLAATNCLNFANPENPEVMWQFQQTIEGMKKACETFQTPITGGNVSFYNETNGEGIPPTPVIGMVGKIDDVKKVCGSAFAAPGHMVYLLGETFPELGGSVYLEVLGRPLAGPAPRLDLKREQMIQALVLRLTEACLIESAHDVSEGGLLFALLECCLSLGVGLHADLMTQLRPDYLLFSESPSRVIVSVSPEKEPAFLALAGGAAMQRIGKTASQTFEVHVNGEALVSLDVKELMQAWKSPFEKVFRH